MPTPMKSCGTPLFLETPWLWLMFSLYYFVPFANIHGHVLTYVFLIAAYLSFVALYIRATKLNNSHVWKPLSAIMVLFVLVTPFSSGSSSFFTYIGFFLGFCYAPRTYLILLFGSVASIIAFQLRYHYPISEFLLPAISGVIATSLWGYIERIRSSARKHWMQSRQEIQQLATIAERERIARDLHDILGHTLSSIALKAELAEKLLKQAKTADAQVQVTELHQIARESLSLVRQTVSGYKHRGLSGEVIQLCDKLRQNGFSVDLTGDIPALSARAETALILALTELTTNVLRHSKGNHCQLTFSLDEQRIMISMQDNGCAHSITPGNGLTGIQERLHALAGDISAHINRGCRFDISLPAHELTQVTSL